MLFKEKYGQVDEFLFINDFLDRLIQDPALIHAQDDKGRTHLHWAAEAGYIDIVEMLLAKGANVNQLNKFNSSPLILALIKKHEEIAEMLLAKGANVNVINNNKYSPLILAIMKNYENIVEILLVKGADVNVINNKKCSILTLVAENGNVEIVNKLLERGAMIDLKVGNQKLYSPLSEAIRQNHIEVIDILLNAGADVNHLDPLGYCPLFYAVKNNDEFLVYKLLNKGVDINKKNKKGRCALMVATENDNTEIFNILLKNGAIIEQKDKYGSNVLHFAARNGSIEHVKLIIEMKLDMNAGNNIGWTPLHFAAEKNHASVIEYLVKEGGVNIDAKDKAGKTALDIAVINYAAATIKVLIKLGCVISDDTSTEFHTELIKDLVNSNYIIQKLFVKREENNLIKNSVVSEESEITSSKRQKLVHVESKSPFSNSEEDCQIYQNKFNLCFNKEITKVVKQGQKGIHSLINLIRSNALDEGLFKSTNIVNDDCRSIIEVITKNSKMSSFIDIEQFLSDDATCVLTLRAQIIFKLASEPPAQYNNILPEDLINEIDKFQKIISQSELMREDDFSDPENTVKVTGSSNESDEYGKWVWC